MMANETNQESNNTSNTCSIYFDGYVFVKRINKNVSIVKHKITNQLYIQKLIPENESDINIFRYFSKKNIPHTPKIIEIKRLDNSFFVIIKEYIEGESLTNLMNSKNFFNNNFFYDFMYKLCDIFNYFHSLPMPIVYRDIKKDNIIITKTNDIKLIDLDSMIFYDPTQKKDEHMKGTEGYASPEQYGFASSSPASDIYTIGSLMEHILPYFHDKKLNKKMKPIIEKCHKMDPNDRYKSVKILKNNIYKREKNYRLISIPGFRNGNYYHMLIATLTYILIFYYCFSHKNHGSYKSSIISFVYIILIIFFLLNYLGIHRLIPLTNSKNILIKGLGIGILMAIISTALFVVCTFIYCII